MAKMNGLMVTGVIALVAVLGLLSYFAVMQTGFGGDDAVSPSECQVDTVLYIDVIDALNSGSSVSAGATAKINGGASASFTSGTTKLAPGDKVELLLNATNYLDVIESTTVKCGINRVTVKMFATDDGTFRIFNTNGQLLYDNITGATDTNYNQSALSATGSLELKIDSKQDQSLGDLIVVIEADNTTQVDSIGLSGASNAAIPEFYSVNAAGSITEAFRIAAPAGGWDGQTKTFTLTISPESGVTIDGTGVYVTAYSEQAFADTDGSYKIGVENSDGTVKYEDDFGFDFLID